MQGPENAIESVVVQLNHESLTLAGQLLRSLDQLDRDARSGDAGSLAKWARRLPRRPHPGWLAVARSFAAVERDAARQGRMFVATARHYLNLVGLKLEKIGRDAGHDVEHAKDLETLLLDLETTLPRIGLSVSMKDIPDAFELLKSVRDLELASGRRTNSRRRRSKPTRQEKSAANRRRNVIVLAWIIRMRGIKVTREVVAKAELRAAASAGMRNSASPTPMARKRSAIAPTSSADSPRPSHNALPDEELERRKQIYTRLRTLQSAERRAGRHMTDAAACAACGITASEFHRIRKFAREQRWPDPRNGRAAT